MGGVIFTFRYFSPWYAPNRRLRGPQLILKVMASIENRRPYQNFDGQSPASHRRVPNSRPGQSIRNLLWTKCHRGRLLSDLFVFHNHHSISAPHSSVLSTLHQATVTRLFLWVWNLVFQLMGRTQKESFGDQVAEENIWTSEGGSGRRLEEAAQWGT
jgi:hypothetical protein